MADKEPRVEFRELGASGLRVRAGKIEEEFLPELRGPKGRKALKESEELYKKLVETSPEAVTVTDMEGYITHVSQRTLELHGFERADELLGKNAFELIALKDRERAMVNLQKTLKEGEVRNVEYTLLRKDGSSFIGELHAALVGDSSGNRKAFIATVRDITEKKRAEEQIKASLKEKENSQYNIE